MGEEYTKVTRYVNPTFGAPTLETKDANLGPVERLVNEGRVFVSKYKPASREAELVYSRLPGMTGVGHGGKSKSKRSSHHRRRSRKARGSTRRK